MFCGKDYFNLYKISLKIVDNPILNMFGITFNTGLPL